MAQITGAFVEYLGRFYLAAEQKYGRNSAELDEVCDVIFVALAVEGELTRIKRLRLIALCGEQKEVAGAK